MSKDETLTSDELRETWEVEFDDKMEEKDGEVTETGQESGDIFELMTQLMKLPETNNNVNKNRTSTASLPAHHLLFNHPLYHEPWNIPKAPVMKQFKSHNAIDMKVDDGNIEQSYTNTMYTTTDIPPPPFPPTNDIPPPPPMTKKHGFSRIGSRNNRRPLRHNSAQSMQLPHHGGLPMHQISRSWNANIADYHYNNGIFYGYTAALQHIQSLQHHKSLQLNDSNVGIPQFNKQRTHTNTRTNHGKYLLPHNEHSKTDTQNTVISDLSKHSPNDTMILHINTSDMDSGEDEADDNDENVNDEEEEEIVDKDREDSQQQSQSDITKTMSSNVNGLLPYIRSHAVVDMPPMSVDSSHIVENKNDENQILIESVNENLNNIGSMSDDDDYDTHTTGGTTYKSSFDGSPQSPQFMIQITPEVTVSRNDIDNDDEDDINGDKSVIINDQEPLMKLNISQQISDGKIKNVVNSIAALPENDVIGDDDENNEESKENIEEEDDVKIEDVMNEEKINKSVEIEIPKEDSKTFKSFTIEKDDQMSECSATPIPKECISSTTRNNNKSEYSQTDNKSKDDISTGFAIQLIGNKEEPTLTDAQSNSTVIEDTYLKYLNM